MSVFEISLLIKTKKHKSFGDDCHAEEFKRIEKNKRSYEETSLVVQDRKTCLTSTWESLLSSSDTPPPTVFLHTLHPRYIHT